MRTSIKLRTSKRSMWSPVIQKKKVDPDGDPLAGEPIMDTSKSRTRSQILITSTGFLNNPNAVNLENRQLQTSGHLEEACETGYMRVDSGKF